MVVDKNTKNVSPWKKYSKEHMEWEIEAKSIYSPDEEFPQEEVEATLKELGFGHVVKNDGGRERQ